MPNNAPDRQYYEEVFGFQPGHLFEVSYGLFLESSLHRAFDRGEWGLFPDPLVSHARQGKITCLDCFAYQNDENLVVHVFYGEKHRRWHGKVVQRSRFRIAHESQLPDRRLLMFHYKQCLIKHVRGFSFFNVE